MTKLQEAVIKQLGYTTENFEEDTEEQGYGENEVKGILEDIAKHGADSGWSGFIYYKDTLEFTRKHRHLIMALVKDYSAELGQNAVEMIMSFNCLDRSNPAQVEAAGRFVYGGTFRNTPTCDSDTIYNALAWFALEEVARQLTE